MRHKIAYWADERELAGTMLPRFYGVAWIDLATARIFLAIMPLNRFLALMRDIWLLADRFLRGNASIIATREKWVYQRGFDDGFHRGKTLAYEEILT